MKKRLNHLIFYDGVCGLCDQIVQFLLQIDTEELFVFAPLQGETSKQYLQQLPAQFKDIDSIILIENYRSDKPKIHVLSKAVFRICWLLGKKWSLIGFLYFLPAILFDWAYRLVAKNRYRLFRQSCLMPSVKHKNRFLP